MTKAELLEVLAGLISDQRDPLGRIQFVETDPQEVLRKITALYEALTKRTLARADPVYLFLETIAAVIVQQRVLINYVGSMNLLRYAAGEFLDEMGYFVGAGRLPDSAALSTVEITLSEARQEPVAIPQGTRVTAGDNIFFATRQEVVIPAGQTAAQVTAVCTQPGTIGNGYGIGEINQIVDYTPFVQSMVNVTESTGGAEIEEDDRYRERIHEAPESYSTAGPDGAYRFWAMSANANIVDVKPVMYPNPGDVTLYVLMVGGEMPSEEVLQQVLATVSPDDKRPLTDHVYAEAPEQVDYEINGTYYIHTDDQARVAEIRAQVEAALAEFVLWQKSAIARDINPSRLHRLIVGAGAKRLALESPEFKKLTGRQVAKDIKVNLTYGGLEDD